MEAGSFAALTRRFSRAALEAAGSTDVTSAVSAEARKRKRKNNKGKGDVNKRCKQQAADFVTLVELTCGNDVACQERGLACADPLATCDFGGFLQCVLELNNA